MATNEGTSKTANSVNPTYSSIGHLMYLNEETADVYFSIELNDDRIYRIPAHKSHLAAASNIFRVMFYGPKKEEGDVKIADTSVAAFKEFLKIFYYPNLELSMENVGDVMKLSKRFEIDECFKSCVKLIHRSLTFENVCKIYDIAIFYGNNDLLLKCKETFVINAKAIFGSASFLACSKELLGKILELDEFSCSETVVFEACMAWIKAASRADQLTKTHIQLYLGTLFHRIRFASMSLHEFYYLLPTYGQVFSVTDIIEILQLIENKEGFEAKSFTANKRLTQIVWNEEKKLLKPQFSPQTKIYGWDISNVLLYLTTILK